jgi:hypothetical protein
MDVDGEPVPRLFVSAQSGQGVAELRQLLALKFSQKLGSPLTGEVIDETTSETLYF